MLTAEQIAEMVRDIDSEGPGLLGEHVRALAAEVERLAAITHVCSCDCNPATTDGPEITCPIHGAVRGMWDAHEEIQRLKAELAQMTTSCDVLSELCRELDGKTSDERVSAAELKESAERDLRYQRQEEAERLREENADLSRQLEGLRRQMAASEAVDGEVAW